MDGLILNQTARTTGTSPILARPARQSEAFFTKDFWAVAFFGLAGLALGLCVAFSSPCTGVDVNVGCVPIEMTARP